MIREFLKQEHIADGFCGREKKNRNLSKQL